MNGSKGSILIIDDERGWTRFSRSILTKAGYVVEVTSDIVEAGNHLSRQAFDLILVNLKQAQEGGEALQKVIRPSPDERRCVVLLFPTQLSPVEMVEGFKAGAYDCVDKPFDTEGLISIAKIYLPGCDKESASNRVGRD